ncbi:MAG: hypothetical protein IT393_04495 [Nitrospirae bacterium]|nr:hypothetical protein [Nitrospirota bacterium]
MNDNPLLQYLRELCSFLETSNIEYILEGWKIEAVCSGKGREQFNTEVIPPADVIKFGEIIKSKLKL